MKNIEIGLFNKSGKWFRFSKYVKEEYNDQIFILPAQGAKMIEYSPMKSHLEILRDFYEFMQKITDIIKPIESIGIKRVYSSVGKRKWNNILDACAAEYVCFANKWGLMGIWAQRIYGIFENPEMNGGFTLRKAVNPTFVLTNINNIDGRMISPSEKIPDNNLMPYADYIERFFPRPGTSPAAPADEDNFESIFSNYGEDVRFLIFNRTFQDMLISFNAGLEYELNKNSMLKGEKIDSMRRMSLSISPYRLSFCPREDESSPIEWGYKSLLEAISILYILNRIGFMGKYVNVCGAKSCHKVFIDDRPLKYCPGTSCGESARRYRTRKAAQAKKEGEADGTDN